MHLYPPLPSPAVAPALEGEPDQRQRRRARTAGPGVRTRRRRDRSQRGPSSSRPRSTRIPAEAPGPSAPPPRRSPRRRASRLEALPGSARAGLKAAPRPRNRRPCAAIPHRAIPFTRPNPALPVGRGKVAMLMSALRRSTGASSSTAWEAVSARSPSSSSTTSASSTRTAPASSAAPFPTLFHKPHDLRARVFGESGGSSSDGVVDHEHARDAGDRACGGTVAAMRSASLCAGMRTTTSITCSCPERTCAFERAAHEADGERHLAHPQKPAQSERDEQAGRAARDHLDAAPGRTRDRTGQQRWRRPKPRHRMTLASSISPKLAADAAQVVPAYASSHQDEQGASMST